MDFFELLEKFKKEVHFKTHDKDELRGRILRFIEAEASVRERELARFGARSVIPGFFSMSSTAWVAAAIVILFITGGVTSFAAERSLPGDLLYAIKVGVNENLVAAFSFSAEAKANWESRLAERRLEEITKLAVKDGIKPEVKIALEDNFESHAQKARDGIREVEAEGKAAAAAGIASNLEGLLKAHGRVLSSIEAESTSSEKVETIGDVHYRVDEEIGNVTDVRTDLEWEVQQNGEDEAAGPQTEVRAAAEEKLKAAVNAIGEARSFLDAKKDKLDAQTVADAGTKLASADALVADASGKLQSGDYGSAFILSNQAIRTAQEVKLLINANAELNVNVKISEPEDENVEATSSEAIHTLIREIVTKNTSSNIDMWHGEIDDSGRDNGQGKSGQDD